MTRLFCVKTNTRSAQQGVRYPCCLSSGLLVLVDGVGVQGRLYKSALTIIFLIYVLIIGASWRTFGQKNHLPDRDAVLRTSSWPTHRSHDFYLWYVHSIISKFSKSLMSMIYQGFTCSRHSSLYVLAFSQTYSKTNNDPVYPSWRVIPGTCFQVSSSIFALHPVS